MCSLQFTNAKNNLIEDKCLCCNENYQKMFDENVKTLFVDVYKLYYIIYKRNINNFIFFP